MNHECIKNETFKELRKDIEKLYDKSEEIIRLNTLVNQNVQTLKDQGKVLQELSKTMIKLGENLTVQHETLKELNSKVEKSNSRIEELDRKVGTQGTVNVWDNLKKAVPYLLVAGFIYLLSNGDKILNLIK